MRPVWHRCLRACRSKVPASTINRLCASGMDAVVLAGRGIGVGDYQLAFAGGVESIRSRPTCHVKQITPLAVASRCWPLVGGL